MLNPDDRETLEEYRRAMVEVRDTRLTHESVSYSVTLGSQDRSAATLPKEDDLRALFVAFRHLWLDDERANFTKVRTVLHGQALTPEERATLDAARQRWKEVCRSREIKINIGAGSISPRHYINTYFNGLYFHRDKDKREQREALEAALGVPLARALLMDWVLRLVVVAAVVEQIVVNVLEREAAARAPTGTG